MRVCVRFLPLVLCVVFGTYAFAEEEVLTIEYEPPDEAIEEALGLVVHRFKVSLPPGYALNVEWRLRHLRGDPELDAWDRGNGNWYFDVAGFENHEIYVGTLDSDMIRRGDFTPDMRFISSEGASHWFAVTKWERSAMVPFGSDSRSATVQAGVDILLMKMSMPTPREEDQEWLTRHFAEEEIAELGGLEMELIVRAEPITDRMREGLSALSGPNLTSLVYTYSPWNARRFYPWQKANENAADEEPAVEEERED